MDSNIDEYIEHIDHSICAVCFDTLEQKLKNVKPQTRPFYSDLVEKKVTTAMFVTWMINQFTSEELRGCIGLMVI
ncbi:bifunctional AMMECR1 [Babesia duncani]|uniref:Bifunctional AMMECR1 n=1 Tax=Babesia duncani TaxID=323732 RepID=A0AAD9PNR9_9APIC|nr:bifunctional AMMECR1 [Babesia duncani]